MSGYRALCCRYDLIEGHVDRSFLLAEELSGADVHVDVLVAVSGVAQLDVLAVG